MCKSVNWQSHVYQYKTLIALVTIGCAWFMISAWLDSKISAGGWNAKITSGWMWERQVLLTKCSEILTAKEYQLTVTNKNGSWSLTKAGSIMLSLPTETKKLKALMEKSALRRNVTHYYVLMGDSTLRIRTEAFLDSVEGVQVTIAKDGMPHNYTLMGFSEKNPCGDLVFLANPYLKKVFKVSLMLCIHSTYL